MTEFAKKLAELRKAAGETQEQLGEVIGVSGKTVSKWESDAAEPDLSTLLALAEHYETTADALIGKEQTGDFDRLVLDELTADGTVAGVFRKAFEMEAKEAAAMMNALSTVTNGDGQSFNRQLTENTNDAIPNYVKPDYPVERQIIHLDMGCRYAVWNDEINLTVGVYRNKSDFAWLLGDAERIAELFSFFADADALKVIYFISRKDYPAEFTAEYTARTAGISTEKAASILDRLAEITSNDQGAVYKNEIELTDGMRQAYSFEGNGKLLALCTVAYNIMRGVDSNSGWNGTCKLIGTTKKGE